MSGYNNLSRAQLSYEYLHTNSTTHEFLFGALAELVDNSRDAGASRLNIYTVPDPNLRGGYKLYFQDDGDGMDPGEAAHVITFGRSIKRGVESNLIGQYGNGLKSGSMRIGNDVIVFTKKRTTCTCVMLSRTFHEEEKIEEVIVPLPSFHAQNLAPLHDSTRKSKEVHETEMELILKYSPFHTRDEFFAQFKRITENSGTIVIVYNLKLLDNGDTELDFDSQPEDILLAGTDPQTDKRLGLGTKAARSSNAREWDPLLFQRCPWLVPERYSFRAYAAILYLEPRMKVYIQGKKVQSRRFVYTLYKPRSYQYSSARFKARSVADVKKTDNDLKVVSNRLREAESKARDLEKKFMSKTTNQEARAKLRTAQQAVDELKAEKEEKELILKRKKRNLAAPKSLTFVYGLNLENRHFDGLFIYNCCRLIKMYEKSGPQLEDGAECRGVVGVVNIPYIVLEPTHNKQDFADGKEYRHLLKSLGEHMGQYWRDGRIGDEPKTIDNFWEKFGYSPDNWTDPPADEMKYMRKRAMETKVCIQCDSCLKWRILPFANANIGKEFADDWVCSMNEDTAHNRCSTEEEKMTISEGFLQRIEKSKADKEREIEQQMSKLKKIQQKMKKTEPVLSSRAISESMSRAASAKQKIPPKKYVQERSYSPRKKKRTVATSARGRGRPAKVDRSKSSSVESDVSALFGEPDDDEDDDDDDEDEYDKRKTKTQEEVETEPDVVEVETPPRPKRQTSVKAAAEADSDPEPDPEPVPKRSRPTPAATTARRKSLEDLETARARRNSGGSSQSRDSELNSWPDDNSDTENEVSARNCQEGTNVAVKVKQKWFSGKVVKHNAASGTILVKFDKYPQDKYDKTVSLHTPDLIVCEPCANAKASTTVPSSTENTTEVPSSSTPGENSLFEEIVRNYRTCLHYFLPPNWIMEKDVVNNLQATELSTFPLESFFDEYEKGLRKLVSGFQVEASTFRQEKERAEASLGHTSRLIARLLNSIHEECNLDPERDLDKVDELLLACVQQAEMAAARTNQVTTSSTDE